MDLRGGISLIYAALAETSKKPSYALSWEWDVEISWEADTSYRLFQWSFKGIVNVSLIEARVKLITHWSRVPSCLAKIYLGSLPLCFQGFGHMGSLFHTWWQCSCIRDFWNRIFCLLCRVTGLAVPKAPKITLLNNKPFGCSKCLQKLIHFILLDAKIPIAQAWKEPTVSFSAAKLKISWILVQEKVVGTLIATSTAFEAVWEPWSV